MNNIIDEMFTVTDVQVLLEVLDKISHQNEELEQTIEELQSELSDSKNDLKQARNEINLLNKQIDKLITENKQLKLRNKMLTKIGFNSIYGIHYCKNHWVYTDTDSIKSESEANKHDSNN